MDASSVVKRLWAPMRNGAIKNTIIYLLTYKSELIGQTEVEIKEQLCATE